MTAGRWKRLDRAQGAAFHDALLQVHHAVQVVAAAGQNLARASPDDRHRALTWNDGGGGRFVGAVLEEAGGARMALRVADLTLEWLEEQGGVGRTLPLAGRTLEDGFAWLEEIAGGPMARPEYEIPTHPVGAGASFDASAEALEAVASLYASAADVLHPVAAALERASPVRVWPHHFDMATLVTVEPPAPDGTERSIGVGMAPMGGGYQEWYWYVTPWPYPDPRALPELDGPGHWHTEGWVGAVLQSRDVLEADAEFRPAVVRKFVDTAMAAALTALA